MPGQQRLDPAVRAVKRLPRNRNVPVTKTNYICGFCTDMCTTSITGAWVHTMDHGPWPVKGSAALALEPPLKSLSYDNGEGIFAVYGGPNVRRLTSGHQAFQYLP